MKDETPQEYVDRVRMVYDETMRTLRRHLRSSQLRAASARRGDTDADLRDYAAEVQYQLAIRRRIAETQAAVQILADLPADKARRLIQDGCAHTI